MQYHQIFSDEFRDRIKATEVMCFPEKPYSHDFHFIAFITLSDGFRIHLSGDCVKYNVIKFMQIRKYSPDQCRTITPTTLKLTTKKIVRMIKRIHTKDLIITL